VVFDTLAASLVGGDESATRDMTDACAALKRI